MNDVHQVKTHIPTNNNDEGGNIGYYLQCNY